MSAGRTFATLPKLAAHLRNDLKTKNYVLLFAYNGIGKTRLSVEFKNFGKKADDRDTLYFNAFTEDLFSWDNDLEGDADRKLILNRQSHFFDGLNELEMDNRIRPLLQRYADFDFRIDPANWCVRFSRTLAGITTDNIKVSRGEENIFIWCFFLAIVRLAMDGAEAYKWVKYVYIDDPISSLDEHNAISVANHLAQLLSEQGHALKSVISTHHPLFFNVLYNEFRSKDKKYYFLTTKNQLPGYCLKQQEKDTPLFHHVALLQDLDHAASTGKLYTYHFNMLRSVMEKTASFHGLTKFSECLKLGTEESDHLLHARLINILSHGNYSLYEPREMNDENKEHFRTILKKFTTSFHFNPQIFTEELGEAQPDDGTR